MYTAAQGPLPDTHTATAIVAMIVGLCAVYWRTMLRLAAIILIFLVIVGAVLTIDDLRQAGI